MQRYSSVSISWHQTLRIIVSGGVASDVPGVCSCFRQLFRHVAQAQWGDGEAVIGWCEKR